MNNATIDDRVRTKPAEAVPSVPRNQAVSFQPTFASVAEVVGKSPPPKRPNRNKPASALVADTPTLEALLELAKANQPPQEFFDADMERPW